MLHACTRTSARQYGQVAGSAHRPAVPSSAAAQVRHSRQWPQGSSRTSWGASQHTTQLQATPSEQGESRGAEGAGGEGAAAAAGSAGCCSCDAAAGSAALPAGQPTPMAARSSRNARSSSSCAAAGPNPSAEGRLSLLPLPPPLGFLPHTEGAPGCLGGPAAHAGALAAAPGCAGCSAGAGACPGSPCCCPGCFQADGWPAGATAAAFAAGMAAAAAVATAAGAAAPPERGRSSLASLPGLATGRPSRVLPSSPTLGRWGGRSKGRCCSLQKGLRHSAGQAAQRAAAHQYCQ